MEESLICQWSVIKSLLAILQWWTFNITVIVVNKWIFQKLDFKFPLSVSCVHFICSAIGGYMVIKVLKLKPLIAVDPQDRWKRIFPMSFVFCINIVLGNVSLRHILVSFMQTIKSLTPATIGDSQSLCNISFTCFMSNLSRTNSSDRYELALLCCNGWSGENILIGVFGLLLCPLLEEFFSHLL